MTSITIRKDGKRFGINMNGHAGFNPNGPDIVCAGCSTLAYTLLQSVLSAEAEGGVNELEYKEDPKKGSFLLNVTPKAWAYAKVQNAYKVVSDGFALLAQKYPKNVKLRCISGEK